MSEEPRFDAFVMVDWSASSSPGRPSGQVGGIWAAVGEPDRDDEVRPFTTRAEVTSWLVQTCARLADEGRQVLLGVDVAFGYPAGTARALGAPSRVPPWRWTWDHLALEVADGADNRNDRFAVAAALNARLEGGAGPFWGHPPTQAHSHLAPTKGPFPVRARGGVELAEYRHAERWHRERGRQPKSVWQLSGAGAVGSQTLLGLPRLRQVLAAPALAGRCRVWPQETGFGDPLGGDRPDAAADTGGRVVLVEVYPSLAPVEDDLHPIRDAAQVLALVRAYRAMAEAGTLADRFAAPDLPDDALGAVIGEEGWILDLPAGVVEDPAAGETTGSWAISPPIPPAAATSAVTSTAASTAASISAVPFDWAVQAAEDVVPPPAGPVRRGRLRTAADAPAEGEAFHELVAAGATRVVEILSSADPGHEPTTQDEDEWVVVLDGRAELDVDGTAHALEAGDWLWLPAGTPHRVTATAAGTRWLAVHIG